MFLYHKGQVNSARFEKKTMKRLIFILFIGLTTLNGFSQYSLEWRKQVMPVSTPSNWISHSHLDSNSLIYNLRWYDFRNDTSQLLNHLYQLDTSGNVIWDFDWNIDFQDHEFRFIPAGKNRVFFTANARKTSEISFSVGLLELGVGIVWEKSKLGSVSTGHLAKHSEIWIDNCLTLLSYEDETLRLTNFSMNGDEKWSIALPDNAFNQVSILNDNSNKTWLLENGKRWIYDQDGILILQDSLLPTWTPGYNSGYSINQNNELYQIHWVLDQYLFTGHDESLNSIQNDTFSMACPAFGDWQLFLIDDNAGSQYLGGLEICETHTSFQSNIMGYSDKVLDWTYSTDGMISAMATAKDFIFYLNDSEIGVLNKSDGTIHWIEHSDRLNHFSDYSFSLLVEEDAQSFYVFSRDKNDTEITYVSKYSAKPNSGTEIRVNESYIYPNPSSGKIYIHESLDSPLNYELFNTLGKRVDAGTIHGGTLNLDQCPTGEYLLKIEGMMPQLIVIH